VSATSIASPLDKVPPIRLLPTTSKIDPLSLSEALRVLRAFAPAPQTIDLQVVVSMHDKTVRVMSNISISTLHATRTLYSVEVNRRK
jgi:hypothetical protein